MLPFSRWRVLVRRTSYCRVYFVTFLRTTVYGMKYEAIYDYDDVCMSKLKLIGNVSHLLVIRVSEVGGSVPRLKMVI
jgi:hypothetical protein